MSQLLLGFLLVIVFQATNQDLLKQGFNNKTKPKYAKN
jgi:hypothetical protein